MNNRMTSAEYQALAKKKKPSKEKAALTGNVILMSKVHNAGPMVQEHKFHPERKWRFDFAFTDLKIAIEYDGLAFQVAKSRHTTLSGFTGDCDKLNQAQILGWVVLRYTALNHAKIIQEFEAAFKMRSA